MEVSDEFRKRYERFVKPMEEELWGKFAAVNAHGSLVLADTLLEAMTEGRRRLGPGLFVYRIGEVSVGMLR